MAVTVEPGGDPVGCGGVCLENTVIVRDCAAGVLTSSSKEPAVVWSMG